MSLPTLPKNEGLDLENKTMTLLQFTKHEVKNADDWSEWVCPDPKSYMMKCCDCGLVHEAQFGVVQYAVGSNEDCEPVVDQNVQAVFRMRRSHPWTTEDMAHRPGGLTLETPLPPSTLYDTRQCSDGHTNDSMREYGQACRDAALEEAVDAIETANARRVVYLLDAIEIIRSLK